MKAFQLKIAIKNSKPPIWRRVIVPAGITFSQLSIILNKVMGWCGYHLFEFEFYHRELRIIEDADDMAIGYGPFDYLEASTTFVREFLEEEEWFTYTYDLGDDWTHRVTIEKVIMDYEYNYPKVLKYKGDCPIEDCGGIYGYYECLEIISDPTHPEYEDRLEWMQLQGYPNEYDLENVNQALEEELFYIWGKGEKKTQSQIYEKLFSGNSGLQATKRDKNKNLAINRSGKHKFEEAADLFAKMVQEELYRSERLENCTLVSIFEDYEKEDIYEIATEKGVTGIAGCSKKQLIKKLVDFMLQPEIMQSYFLCLQDEEIEEFEKAAKKEGFYESDNREYLMKLYKTDYIGMLEDGSFRVPQDVWTQFSIMQSEEFHSKRQIVSFVLGCLRVAGVLYGIAPIDIILKMINQNQRINVTADELKKIMEGIPPEFSDYVIKNGKVYYKELYPNDRGLLQTQGNKEYYIPTVQEINEFSIYGYFPHHAETMKFKSYLIKELGAMEDETELLVKIIQRKICGDFPIKDILEVLYDFEIIAQTEREWNKLIKQIGLLQNDTRMMLNRGFTPNELSQKHNKCVLLADKTDNVIDFQEARKNKVYPNDPCPCGSGKKYKKCCGKH